jgi:hypothetical protein
MRAKSTLESFWSLPSPRQPSPRQILRLRLPSPKLGRGVGGEGKPIPHSHSISKFGNASDLSIPHLTGHFSIKLKQLFQPLGVVFEAATDVDAFEHFIISIVCFTQIFRHFIGSIEIGDRGWEMRFTGEQDIFGAAGEVGFVLVGEGGDGEGVPAQIVRISIILFEFSADRSDPYEMQF